MKNTAKKTIPRKQKRTSAIFILCALLYCGTILVSGCNEAVMTPTTPSNSVNVKQLVPKARQIIKKSLSDEDPYIRTKAIEIIADTQQIKMMPKVQRLLKDDSVPVRFLAAMAVGDTQYSLAENDTAQLLKDENQNVRIAASYAMVKLGHVGQVDNLYKAIASNDQTVRANAALLLGKVGDRNSLKFLYWALRHKDSADKVKFQAVEAIAKIGDERIYPKLWAMLRNVYADDRVTGIRGMGQLATENSKNVLITMLDDNVPEVRLAAAEQLGILGDTTGETEVIAVFRKNIFSGLDKRDEERIKARAAFAIGHIGTAPLIKYLPSLLENDSKLVRIAAAKAVFLSLMNK